MVINISNKKDNLPVDPSKFMLSNGLVAIDNPEVDVWRLLSNVSGTEWRPLLQCNTIAEINQEIVKLNNF